MNRKAADISAVMAVKQNVVTSEQGNAETAQVSQKNCILPPAAIDVAAAAVALSTLFLSSSKQWNLQPIRRSESYMNRLREHIRYADLTHCAVCTVGQLTNNGSYIFTSSDCRTSMSKVHLHELAAVVESGPLLDRFASVP